MQNKRTKTYERTNKHNAHSKTQRNTTQDNTFVSRPISVCGSIPSSRIEALVTSIPTPIWTAANTGMGKSDATGWLTQVFATFTMRSDGRNIPYTIW